MTEDEPSALDVPEPSVFVRRTPRWVLLSLIACPLLSVVLPVGLLLLGDAFEVDLFDALEGTEGLPFGGAAVVGTFLGLVVVPQLLLIVVFAAARRRFGSCRLTHDHADFQVALAPRFSGHLSVAFTEITRRRVIANGILLETKGRGRFASWMFPLLIPTRTAEEVAKAVQILDASEPSPVSGPDDAQFGRDFPLRLQAVLQAGLFVLSLVPAVLVVYRYGSFTLLPVCLLGLAIHGPILGVLDFKFIRPYYRKVRIGVDGLLVGGKHVPYAALTSVFAGREVLAYTRAKKRRLTWVGAQLPQARALLAARLAVARPELAIEERLPAWATPKRRKQGVILLGTLSVGFALTVATLAVLPPRLYDGPLGSFGVYDDLVATDDDGNYLHLIYRLGDDSPRFLLLEGEISRFTYRNDTIRVPGLFTQTLGLDGMAGLGDEVRIDLETGAARDLVGAFSVPSDSTFVHLQPNGLRVIEAFTLPAGLRAALEEASLPASQPPSLPALFDSFAETVDSPGLADFVAGRSSRRVHDVVDSAGMRLMWGVDYGTVVFVAVLSVDMSVELAEASLVHAVGEGTPLVLSSKVANLTVATPSGELKSLIVDLPSLDTLLEATARVGNGQTVREALLPALESYAELNER